MDFMVVYWSASRMSWIVWDHGNDEAKVLESYRKAKDMFDKVKFLETKEIKNIK